MDINFIKWLCEKAEGFEISVDQDGQEYISTIHDSIDLNINTPLARNVYYPLLLQRAIESVNRESQYNRIASNWRTISINQGFAERQKVWDFNVGNYTIEQAKELSLRYIYEQES